MEPDLQEIKPESRYALSHCVVEKEYLGNKFIKIYRGRKIGYVFVFWLFSVFVFIYFSFVWKEESKVECPMCIVWVGVIETPDKNWDGKESTRLNPGWNEYRADCMANGEGLVVRISFVFIFIVLNIFFCLIVVQLFIAQFGEIHNWNWNLGPWVIRQQLKGCIPELWYSTIQLCQQVWSSSSLVKDHHWTKVPWFHLLVQLLLNLSIPDQDKVARIGVEISDLVLELCFELLEGCKPG